MYKTVKRKYIGTFLYNRMKYYRYYTNLIETAKKYPYTTRAIINGIHILTKKTTVI